MSEALNRYEIGFKILGLSLNREQHYSNADEFAQRFKRCSILKDGKISYAINTPIERSALSSETSTLNTTAAKI